MTRNSKLILDFFESAWELTGSVRKGQIEWSESWFNNALADKPQVCVVNYDSPKLETFKNVGGSELFIRTAPSFLVCCGQFFKYGSPGTQQLENIEDMREHIAYLLVKHWPTNYGGSLSPLRLALPDDEGSRRWDYESTPRLVWEELIISATKDVA